MEEQRVKYDHASIVCPDGQRLLGLGVSRAVVRVSWVMASGCLDAVCREPLTCWSWSSRYTAATLAARRPLQSAPRGSAVGLLIFSHTAWCVVAGVPFPVVVRTTIGLGSGLGSGTLRMAYRAASRPHVHRRGASLCVVRRSSPVFTPPHSFENSHWCIMPLPPSAQCPMTVSVKLLK